MASGHRKADRIIRWLDGLEAPLLRRRALDFGCGIGRVTIPLAEHFDEVVGVDVAPAMLEQARSNSAAAGCENVQFLVNAGERLNLPSFGGFDLVFTSHVLQHLPSRAQIARYARDLAALVAPGGLLIAQVPDQIGLRDRLQARRRAYTVLRGLGVPPSVLYTRLRLNPIRMVSFARTAFESLLVGEDLRLASVVERRRGTFVNVTYQAVRPAKARLLRLAQPSAAPALQPDGSARAGVAPAGR
jgi:2-polyprenyl-3-methyl-5-hydroxy-6-metoxy-1,4-benzoquinol methylase